MKVLARVLVLILLVMSMYSCEEQFIPDDISTDPLLVVEGHIEPSSNMLPAYVVLTNSIPFFSNLGAEEFNDIFIQDALVEVNDGSQTVRLNSVCLSDLPPALREEVAIQFGIDLDDTALDFCIYIDVMDNLNRAEGKTYTLNIESNETTLSASTTISSFVGLDSIWFTDVPGEASDTLLRMTCRINDPAGEENFYRYFTGEVNEPLTIPFQSVTDDLFFNGQEFDFPLSAALNRQDELDPETFGFFRTNDTVVVRWCSIDKPHFDFWNSLEFSLNSVGPFAAYTRVNSNVENGIGIWGGYNCEDYTVVVEK